MILSQDLRANSSGNGSWIKAGSTTTSVMIRTNASNVAGKAALFISSYCRYKIEAHNLSMDNANRVNGITITVATTSELIFEQRQKATYQINMILLFTTCENYAQEKSDEKEVQTCTNMNQVYTSRKIASGLTAKSQSSIVVPSLSQQQAKIFLLRFYLSKNDENLKTFEAKLQKSMKFIKSPKKAPPTSQGSWYAFRSGMFKMEINY
uniref:Uncharacterized protein n=1 Tax=Romanomermis culicivorax TaxID=13658 RepID=A0A915HX62_ROMCU